MTPDRLLEHFDRLADAPGAIPRLRMFILGLAAQGRLVEQHSDDGDGWNLLRQIESTRHKQRKVRQITAEPEQSPLAWLPKSWGIGTVDAVAADEENAITDGPFGANLKTEHYITEPGYRVIRLQNIGPGYFKQDYRSYIDRGRFERLWKHHVHPGDLVVAGLVDPIMRSCEVPNEIGPALVKADCYRFKVSPSMSSRFVLFYLNSPFCQAFAVRHHHGMTLTRIGLGNFRGIPVPVPPLAEQHRIVARVDELMALCDRLEAAQAEREIRRDRLVAASLHRLSEPANDGEEARESARFYLNRLPKLVTRPEHVKGLRQAILSLAVRGRLVPQDPNDERASELYKRIQDRKAASIAAARQRRIATDPTSGVGSIPSSWLWTTTEAICEAVVDCPHSTPKFIPQGVVCLDTNSFKAGAILPAKLRYVSEEAYVERTRRIVPRAGDIVFAREGSVGESVVIPEGFTCCLGQRVMLFRPFPEIDSRYFNLAISEPGSLARMTSLHKGIGAKHVNVADMRRSPLPLPPLAEQQRIVAKVDELMAICDRLEAEIAAGQAQSRRFLEAVLHEALASAEPELEREVTFA